MLSQSSRQEILRKLNSKLRYEVNEENLSPGSRQAITNLATVQKHLSVITEILRGENSRIAGSVVLSAAARFGKQAEKSERATQADEINKLHLEVDEKISQLANQVTQEDIARQSGLPPPQYKGRLEPLELKCPSCGAALPMPTGRFVQCQYCKATLSVEDVSSQMRSMIQSI
jgi:Zn finger protein HypA/HybF involved in hydrogenase expression